MDASRRQYYIDSLVQDCSDSVANALELPRSCTKLTIYRVRYSCSIETWGPFTNMV